MTVQKKPPPPPPVHLSGFLRLLLVGLFLFLPQLVFYRYVRTLVSCEANRKAAPIAHFPPATEDTAGLLNLDHSNCSCQSRTELPGYRRGSKWKPADELLSRLQKYEQQHKRCVSRVKIHLMVQADLYSENRGLWEQQTFGQDLEGCQYVVWMAYSGLGNRLLSISSAFLYALLTNRVLLVEGDTVFQDLLCEPFPGSSWYVPETFPRAWLQQLNETSQTRFGHLLNATKVDPPPAYSYLHLTHTHDKDDRKFFCSRSQQLLRCIPWLFMRSNNYLVPGLHFVQPFREELQQLFPQRDTVFYHLSHYLFHPSNEVWGRISRFQTQYLDAADKHVGIQVRTFDRFTEVPSYTMPQILTCVFHNKILPMLNQSSKCTAGSCRTSTTSVLLTSLRQHYFEQLRELFLQQPTDTGEIVSVHQASHEEWQKTEEKLHNVKALAEIFLLSFSDDLVTSAWSTFGYVAHSMAGIRPWILTKAAEGATEMPVPVCSRALSTEPCFHTPPLLDCEGQGGRDPGKILPYIRHCQDIPWGIQLFA